MIRGGFGRVVTTGCSQMSSMPPFFTSVPTLTTQTYTTPVMSASIAHTLLDQQPRNLDYASPNP